MVFSFPLSRPTAMSQPDGATRASRERNSHLFRPESSTSADGNASIALASETRVFLCVMLLNGATSLRIGVVYPVVMWSVVKLHGDASHAGQLLFWCLLVNLFWAPLAGRLLGAVVRKKRILAGALLMVGLVGLLPLFWVAAGRAISFGMLLFVMLTNYLMALPVAGANDYFMKAHVREQVRLARLSVINVCNHLLQMGSVMLAGFLLLHYPVEKVLLLFTLFSWGPLLLAWPALPALVVARLASQDGATGWHGLRELLPLWQLGAYRTAPLLFLIAAIPALVVVFAHGMDALLPALIQFKLQLSSAHYAATEAAWAAGGMAAGVLMARLGTRLPASRRFDLVLTGIGAALLCLAPHLPFVGVVVVLFVLGALAAAMVVRAQDGYLRHCPQPFLGRYRGAGVALSSLAGLMAVSIPSQLAHWGLGSIYALLGGLMLVAIAWLWKLELRLELGSADRRE
jgi:hypothetical protein